MTAPSENQFQHAVIDLAKYRGWLVFHDVDSRRNAAGFPDLVLVHPRTGELIMAELKTAVGRVSAAQQRWLEALLLAGVACFVWRPADMASGLIPGLLTPADAASAVGA